ncbi:MAG TPA: hypothetical protein VFL91_04910 [Thermomicrobiales bacterium]|nr:hypothetical protein [Thermomicrobiales bacterium]
MSAAALLARLEALGMTVAADGADLVLDAPAGALTADLLAAVRADKAELLALLAAGRAREEGRKCWLCGFRVWRTMPDGRVLCAVCNPPETRPRFSLDGLFPRKGR